jgi:hypothetical protein
VISPHENPVIASLGEQFPVPLSAKGYTHAHINARFVDGLGRDNSIDANGCRIVPEEWVADIYRFQARLRKVLVLVIQTSASSHVDIQVPVRIQMHYRIDCRRKYTQVPSAITQIV